MTYQITFNLSNHPILHNNLCFMFLLQYDVNIVVLPSLKSNAKNGFSPTMCWILKNKATFGFQDLWIFTIVIFFLTFTLLDTSWSKLHQHFHLFFFLQFYTYLALMISIITRCTSKVALSIKYALHLPPKICCYSFWFVLKQPHST